MWTEVWMKEAFWQGVWGGVFDLIAIGLVASWVNMIYQRIRSRQNARKELIDELDTFSNELYKPRKVYQALLGVNESRRLNQVAYLSRPRTTVMKIDAATAMFESG